MRPFMYNIFTNDLFLIMEKVQHCSIFNCTENTVYDFQGTFLDVETVLKTSCNLMMINWFSDNLMQASPLKFQCILFESPEKRNPAVI